jgi:hypothetical protein
MSAAVCELIFFSSGYKIIHLAEIFFVKTGDK